MPTLRKASTQHDAIRTGEDSQESHTICGYRSISLLQAAEEEQRYNILLAINTKVYMYLHRLGSY